MEIKPIAHIKSDFKEKFGIPRQSGLTTLKAEIIFCPEFRNPDAIRGLKDFSHLWLIFDFSKAHRDEWSPTVRPPRLGGNTRVGVFATRSPFRPNPIGLSSVKLEEIKHTDNLGDVLIVSGADLLDGTPIFDIKPYLPYSDAHTDASAGFTESIDKAPLKVIIPSDLSAMIPEDKLEGLTSLLSQDPRPSYQSDGERVYKMLFADFEISFKVDGDTLNVIDINNM
ncbi:MAG: tRNA (N6-threonylcarbamoyladenosine(37)-N6)-methyltransferase TrmO [Clostridia bacterium]|nr:tRNA (N6-threonylcarbamoyladenosine(37)-N6)-methyltransferase TrmO [Clostridia bacterium]